MVLGLLKKISMHFLYRKSRRENNQEIYRPGHCSELSPYSKVSGLGGGEHLLNVIEAGLVGISDYQVAPLGCLYALPVDPPSCLR